MEKICHLNTINKIIAIIMPEYCIRNTISNSILFYNLYLECEENLDIWCACTVLRKNIWLLVNYFFEVFNCIHPKFLMELFFPLSSWNFMNIFLTKMYKGGFVSTWQDKHVLFGAKFSAQQHLRRAMFFCLRQCKHLKYKMSKM